MNISFAAAALCLLASPAALAQPPLKCAPEAAVARGLAKLHGETQIWEGRNEESGTSIVVFAKMAGGTWTIMIRQKGMLCGGFHGETWAIPGPLASSDAPS